MDYQTFKKEIYVHILHREETVGKNIRMRDEQLYILWETEGSPCIMQYKLEELYAEYQKSGWHDLIARIAQQVRIRQFLRKYPAVLRPLNFSRNRQELEGGVYRRIGDISLVLYAPICESGEEGTMLQINRETIRKWRLAEHPLLEETLRINCANRPPRLYLATNMSCSPGAQEEIFMFGERSRMKEIEKDAKRSMSSYRLTTLGFVNGAVAIFYPGVQERLAQMFGGDYYIGFINVHEVMVYPVRYKALREIKETVWRANLLCDCRETLTDQVYRYCSSQKRLVEV